MDWSSLKTRASEAICCGVQSEFVNCFGVIRLSDRKAVLSRLQRWEQRWRWALHGSRSCKDSSSIARGDLQLYSS